MTSRVEGSFEPLKIHYDMEDEVVIGIKDTEDFITLNAVAYDLNRLYKLLRNLMKKIVHWIIKKLN